MMVQVISHLFVFVLFLHMCTVANGGLITCGLTWLKC